MRISKKKQISRHKKIPDLNKHDGFIAIAGEIASIVRKAVEELGFGDVEVHLEHPENEEYGDYSTNVALRLWSKYQIPNHKIQTISKAKIQSLKQYQSPRELAEAIAQNIRNTTRLPDGQESEILNSVEKVEVARPGFINFWFSEQFLLGELQRVIDLGESFGKNEERKGKKLMVEFAHPNTHKQFHIGHLRNISLGESLVRIFIASGAGVIRTNYQGDVGLHVAKALWGAKKLGLPKDAAELSEKVKFLGKAYVEGNRAYEEDGKAKKEIQELNVKIYDADPEIKEIWEKTRKWSLEYFDWIYKRVDTRFDRFYFESEVAAPGKEKALKALEKGVLSRSEGAVVFKGKAYGLDTRVFLTKENLPTYEGKELGLAALEFSEFGKIDKCIHVVGPEQKSFFEVTFKVEELLEPEKFKGKQKHFVYGYVQLKGGKMSSRKGTVISGEWLLDEVKMKVKKIMDNTVVSEKEREEVAEQVAVGAVKYSMLKVSPVKDIAFDFDSSISLEGDSGPYLQYTYARCCSVMQRAQIPNSKFQVPDKFEARSTKSETVSNFNSEELAVLRWLYRYPELVAEAGGQYAPNLICSYLYELAGRFNTFYYKHSILGQRAKGKGQREEIQDKILDSELFALRKFRLALTETVAQVLENGLDLLGIKAPKRM